MQRTKGVVKISNSDILNDFPKENRILIDWVSFTTRLHTVSDLIRLLGLTDVPFEPLVGSKGKKERYYFGGISIHFDRIQQDVLTGDYIWLEMSGQGCRAFETHGNGNYQLLFDEVLAHPQEIHLTRLDVAFDDLSGVLDINLLCDETRLENYTSFLKKYQSIYSNGGNSVYFGTRSSNLLIRIYDKAMERGYKEGERHWIRCELQMKDENAVGFVKKLKYENNISEVYRGVLKHYLLYRTPNEFDSNKRRWEIRKWWTAFLDNAVSMSIWDKPGVPYNLSVCEQYVLTQPAHSIKTLISIFGKNAFIEMIEKVPPSKNPKYRRLVTEYEQTKKVKSVHSAVNKLVSSAEEDEYWFIEELRTCLNTLLHVADFKGDKFKATSNAQVNDVLEKIRSLRECRLPPTPQVYEMLNTDDDLVLESEREQTFDASLKALHDSVVEKHRIREEERRAAKANAYLRKNGLNVPQGGDVN